MTLDEINAKYGKPVTAQTNSSLASRWGTQAVPEKKTFMEKVAGFTGGEKIAQGLGQALANKEISKNIEDTQKSQFEIQGNLIKTIKDKTAMGQDTSRLENALKLLNEDISNVGGGAEKLMNQKELTTKEVVGDVLQLGTTVLGAGTLPGVAKKTVAATGIGAGIKQGAIQGSKAGGIYGASSGVSGALKENKTAGEIAVGGVTGAIGGAVTGGILGGAVGGISGGLKQRAINKLTKETNFTQDLVSPKATEAVKQQAFKEGRVTEQGLLSASKITPSKRDLQLADAVKDVVSSKKSSIQNIDAITSKVKDINTGVKAYVSSKKVPFNTKQLTAQLNKGKNELKLIFASDKNAEKTYNAVVKEFIKNVQKKDTAGLLDARQAFDKIPAIRKLLESQGLGENVKREIVLTARTKANEYIASLLPQGNKFRETLLKESKMIEAIGNIVDKSTTQINKNKLQILTEKYPILKYWTSLAIGAGGVGVGSVIIGSSD